MKKVLNVGIGGRSFTIDDDAYQRLDSYLEHFRRKTSMGYQTKEVMDDLEMRIAELFTDALSSKQEVVNLALVNKVIAQLGMPDGTAEEGSYNYYDPSGASYKKPDKKLFRDPDNKVIGGVCGGLAAYFDMDVTILRILFAVALFCGSLGFWAYIIFWIIAPLAKTAANKCEMRGLPVTAENMRKFA